MTAQLLSIQYLRGIAAMMVVLHHSAEPQAWLFDPGWHPGFGVRGVDIFFVISGFIMYTAARHESASEFAWRRIVRIAPLYWLATLAYLAFALLATKGRIASPALLEHVGLSMLFVPHWSLAMPDKAWPFLVPGWTLNYEMFFYVIFAVGLVARRVVAAPTAIIGACVLAGTAMHLSSPAGLTYTNPVLLEFLAGMWLAVLYSRAMLPKLPWLLPLGFAGLVLGGDSIIWRLPASAAVVAGALAVEHRMPRISLLKTLGDASYSIYLSHVLTLIVVFSAAKRLPLAWPQLAAVVVVGLGLSALVGILVHRRVEKPLLRRLSVARSDLPHRTHGQEIPTWKK